MPNKHIEKYLNDYFESSFHPGHAVLLKGEWGCGKTWFIKQVMKTYEKKEKTTEKKLLHKFIRSEKYR